jgi:hypothetical protein
MRLWIWAAVFYASLCGVAAAEDYETTRPCRGACAEFEPSAPDHNLCRIACDADAQCKQWTYSDKGYYGITTDKCYLIPRLTEPRPDPCCVSGVKVVEDTDKADSCRDFSTRAVAQAGENLRLRCGYTGERWSPDRRTHFNWCMSATANERLREQNFRINKLAECADGAIDAEAEQCDGYAKNAVASAQEARKAGCATEGERWSTVYSRHFNFCRIASKSERAAEDAARAASLKQCRADAAAKRRQDDCRDYAEEALQAGAENERLQCGYEGERWNARYIRHFNWCMSVAQDVSDAEREKRRRALRRCREDADGGDPDRSEACRDYSEAAAADQRENRTLACGYAGQRWNSSPAHHYAWCMAASRADRDRVAAERREKLDQCRDAGGGEDGEEETGGPCNDYARASIRDYAENRLLGCGFEGGRWSGDGKYHASWCRTAARGAAAKQAAFRRDLLAMCAAKPKRAANCRSFSNIAIAQQRQNLARGCGFTGTRWHTDYELHWTWCMGVSGTVRDIEAIARQAAIAACK